MKHTMKNKPQPPEHHGMLLVPPPYPVGDGRYYRWKPKTWVDALRLWIAKKLLHNITTVVIEDAWIEITTSSAHGVP